MSFTIVIVPGYTNAGPAHWQTYIERKYHNVVRVKQDDWLSPVRERWISGLNNTIKQIQGDMLLVGHSCGANVIVQWAQQYQNPNIKGALLVAPADIDSPNALPAITVQRPLPMQPLPFRSMVVYSDNDGHTSLARSEYFADSWGSERVLYKGASHFHTEAGFGDWADGDRLIEQLAGRPVLHRR